MVFLRLDYLRPVSCVVSCIFVGSNWHLDLFQLGCLTSWMKICLERSELERRKESVNHTFWLQDLLFWLCHVCCTLDTVKCSEQSAFFKRQ